MDLREATDFTHLIGLMKVSRRRGSAKYSYNQLAERLKFRSPRSIAMVHKGQRGPSLSMINRTCEFLKVTPEEREFVFWLAEKTKLALNGQTTAELDACIDNFRRMNRQTLSSPSWPGIVVRIDASTPDDVRRRLEALLNAAF